MRSRRLPRRQRLLHWAMLYAIPCGCLMWGVHSVSTFRGPDEDPSIQPKQQAQPDIPTHPEKKPSTRRRDPPSSRGEAMTKIVPKPATRSPPTEPHGQQQQQQQQQQSQGKTALPPSISPPDPDTTSLPHKTAATSTQQQNRAFLTWCRQVLGIDTSLVIQTFDYYDYMQFHLQTQDESEDDDAFCDFPLDEDEESTLLSVQDLPRTPVRGLAAAQNVEIGDVVISIPLNAMISVPTTIDHDPVLSRMLGPQARARHSWDDAYFEMPLLTVALLYHAHLGEVSPLHHYLELLYANDNHTMPFLWSKRKLRQEATEGIRTIARGIQRDMKEMYHAVVTVLAEEQPQLFGKPDDPSEEWMYSYAKFQWAFAMVNSRHWHLPIPDLDPVAVDVETPSVNRDGGGMPAPTLGEQVPPADQPTEEWIRGQREEAHDEDRNDDAAKPEPPGHSFLAPVADLLNFGPPCTRGQYNAEKQAFELIATCPFLAGQEVTYWYSDDCADVMIANYGFTHPIVPPCRSMEDWREQAETWHRRADLLEVELETAYQDMNELDMELDDLHSVLSKCDCDDDDLVGRRKSRGEGSRKKQPQQRQDGREARIRGSLTGHNEPTDHERHRIRRKWSNKKSDLGF